MTIDRFAEKYTSITPYQYGANNPIKFIDVNGDSITVSYGDRSLSYDNGNFYENGSLVERNKRGKITGKGSSFFRSVEGMISTLNSTDAGSEIVSQLSGSKNIFDIKYRKGAANFIAGFESFSSPELINNASALQVLSERGKIIEGFPANQFGSGGTIYFDPYVKLPTSTTTGTVSADQTIVLFHELYHAAEANLGLLDGSGRLHNGSSGIVREIRAVYAANILRDQLNKGYYRKTTTSINAQGNLVAPPLPSGFYRSFLFPHPLK